MTPALAAVALYAGLMALIAVWLASIIGSWRRKLGISIGDGGHIDLIRAMRGQANFVENVPLALLLLLIAAMAGAPVYVIHLFGLPLTIGRVLHGWHFAAPGRPGWMRGAGAGLTLLPLAILAIGLIGHAAMAAFG